MIARSDACMDRMDSRFDLADDKLSRLKDRQSSDFTWRLGFNIGATGFLFATMAHGFHWFQETVWKRKKALLF
jgi:hypothetical protein